MNNRIPSVQGGAWSASGPITVAVTGLHRGDNPQPGSAVIRSLRRAMADLRVVGFAYDSLESGLYCNLDEGAPDVAYLLPYPSAGRGEYLEAIEAALERERVTVLIPCLDAEIPLLLDSPVVRRLGACLPSREALAAREKARLASLAGAAGCPAPETIELRDPSELASALARWEGSAYIKGRFYQAALCRSQAEAVASYWSLLETWGSPVLAQQPIVGEEFNVVGVGDGRGAVLGHCAIRKLLRTPLGKAGGGIVIDDPLLAGHMAHIIQALRWRGPFELEFIQDQDGTYRLIEMNPRFPSWVDFPSALGCNLPALVVEKALGSATAFAVPCEPGAFFLRHALDLAGHMGDLAALTTKGRIARETSPLSVAGRLRSTFEPPITSVR